ncbi:MAG: hypothetical protein RIG77_17940 [Cyclobacteriaceae bacterium]
MKNLILKSFAVCSILFFSSCGADEDIQPTQKVKVESTKLENGDQIPLPKSGGG